MKNQLRGIALMLFGILLTLSGDSVNRMVFRDLDEIPFALLGFFVGIAGLVLVFRRGRQTQDKA